jgi:hypothetical protein
MKENRWVRNIFLDAQKKNSISEKNSTKMLTKERKTLRKMSV